MSRNEWETYKANIEFLHGYQMNIWDRFKMWYQIWRIFKVLPCLR